MEQFIGKSMSGDIKEAVYGLQDPKFIILFSKEELFEKNVHEIEKLYPGVPSIGCVGTSYAGNDFVEDGCSVVVFTGSVEAVTGILTDIERTPVLNIKELDDNIKKIDAGSHNTVCIDLCTGNDGCVVTTLNMALGRYDISLAGGTSWSNMVSVNGKVYSDACVYGLVKNGSGKIKTYKENIYRPTNSRFVVTKTDVAEKKIIALDNRPASQVYCEALNIPESKIETQTYENPFGRFIGKDIYIISIKEKQENGIVCFKQVNEMDILTILELDDVDRVVADTITDIRRDFSSISGVFSINCLFRYNLFTEHGYFDMYLNLMNSLGVHSGFVGMGEHYNRQHINQSMSCVVFE